MASDLKARLSYERKAKELSVSEHVIFSERYIPNEEVYLAFSAADVTALPYFYKSFSASGCLHLSLGAFKPAVVSNINKFEEVWHEISGELVFKGGDGFALAQAIIKVLTDETLGTRLPKE